MTSRCLLLSLLLIGAGCRNADIKPVLHERIDLGLNRSARMITPQHRGPVRDLLICTPPEMDEAATLRFAEKLARMGYRLLWVQTPAPAEPAAVTSLLQAGAARLTTPGKKGVILFGDSPAYCTVLSDTVFQAVIRVTVPGSLRECLESTGGSVPAGPRLALLVAAPEAVSLEPAWRTRLTAVEDLVWLATAQPLSALLQSDLEPVIRRKAQLFFDLVLKGKK